MYSLHFDAGNKASVKDVPTSKMVSSLIVKLLEKEKRPLTRRFIEAVLVFEHGADANTVTKCIADLWACGHGRVRKTLIEDLKGSARADFELYSFARISSKIKDKLTSDIHNALGLITEEALTRSGERFVRTILKKSNLFSGVTPKKQLGKVPIPKSKRKGDVLATLREPRFKIVVEVKNAREHWYPTKGVFGLLMVKALALNALPVFVASHISSEALRDCERMGIVAIHLGKQILPIDKGQSEQMISVMRPVIGPTPFEFLNPDRPFKHGGTAWAQQHLDTLSKTDWVSIKARWDNNRDLAQTYSKTLSKDVAYPGGNNSPATIALKQFQKELSFRYPD